MGSRWDQRGSRADPHGAAGRRRTPRMGGDDHVRANPRVWRTRFGCWVHTYGVDRLVRDLTRRGRQVHPTAVYHWVSGRRAPRVEQAAAMLVLSRGQLTIFDIIRRRRYQNQQALHGEPVTTRPADPSDRPAPAAAGPSAETRAVFPLQSSGAGVYPSRS